MSPKPPSDTPHRYLKRELGLFAAVMLGLGSIIGTGVFVSLAIAVDIAGPGIFIATVLAALVALCNGLSSAQLAANHPVSGGTYEYAYRYLNPFLGFSAGWMFLVAKSASAATAALGFAAYFLNLVNLRSSLYTVLLALFLIALVTALAYSGVKRSSMVNTIIVSVTLAILGCFVIIGVTQINPEHLKLTANGESLLNWREILFAAALMFVAYTGYGRIATLGEEVKTPRVTIPRAILITLCITMLLYLSVALIGVGTVGSQIFASFGAAPLEQVSKTFGVAILPPLIGVAAMMAMLGVLLNLILGLSRVLLAMGRRNDMPAATTLLNKQGTTPTVSVISIGIFIALIALLGDVKTTWSFSAFAVLIYYALTNLAALQLSQSERSFPKVISWAGLLLCLGLAFVITPWVWFLGLGIMLLGWLWYGLVTPRFKV